MKKLSLLITLFAAVLAFSLTITEINPRPDSGGVEWFEILNDSNQPLDLNGLCYGLWDEYSIIIDSVFILPPQRYLLVSSDSLKWSSNEILKVVPKFWKRLNNYSDTITLFNSTGIFYDTAIYNYKNISDWKHETIVKNTYGKWVISPNPTPGFPNKVDVSTYSSLIVGPSVITPNGDGKSDKLCVENVSDGRATVGIFSFDGRLLDRTELFPNVKYYWSGTELSGRPADRGPLFIVAEFSDGTSIRKRVVLWR